jgi:hypothetical protein
MVRTLVVWLKVTALLAAPDDAAGGGGGGGESQVNTGEPDDGTVIGGSCSGSGSGSGTRERGLASRVVLRLEQQRRSSMSGLVVVTAARFLLRRAS